MNGELKNSQQIIAAQERQINELTKKIGSKDERIHCLNQELKLKARQILTRDETIQTMEQEISKIYNSQVYRFIVKPIIWPVLSFIKKTGGSFKILYNKLKFLELSFEKPAICISRFYANCMEAVYKGENEYFIRLINKNFKEKKVKILIDIWPYMNRSHPKRHFCYFDAQVLIKTMHPLDIKINYDWETQAKFFVDGQEEAFNIWRGVMADAELYMVELFVYDLEKHILDRISILQRLKK